MKSLPLSENAPKGLGGSQRVVPAGARTMPRKMIKPPSLVRRGPRILAAVGPILLLTALGLVAWAAIWFTTPVPRAAYDTLWYARFAHQYAGASRDEAIDRSWAVFERYGDPERVASVADQNGWPWPAESNPDRHRWFGIYQMRPAMPLVSALAVPWLGVNAPLLASALAVVSVVVVTGTVLRPMTGTLAAAAFLGLTIVNPAVSGWLVHLTTDGLGIALWLAVLAFGARFIHVGRPAWLAAFIACSIVLAFTRQTASVLPITFGLCTLVALAVRAPAWRRLGMLTLAALPAIVLFSTFTTLAGLPSFSDMLQDYPTRHFGRPDVPDPISNIVRTNARHLPRMLQTLSSTPLLWIPALLGLAGFALRPRWWAVPFVCALATVPLLYVLHPFLSQAPRTLAPMWLSVHLGIGLLVAVVLDRARLPLRGLVGGEEPPTSSV